ASKGRMGRSCLSPRIASIRIWSPSGSSTYRSGCKPRSTRAVSPSSSAANAVAMVRFPTPGGPWKRYACASASSSAARSRRLASGCSETFSNASKDLLRDVCGRAASVDRLDPLRKRCRQQTISVGDLPPELLVFPLDPVAVPADPARGLVRVDLEQEGAVGQSLADCRQVQLEHALDTETPRDTLIGERGVEVAVADDDGAALERRSDHLVDELRARR